MVTSLASLLTGRLPSPKVAMTGEITLRGKVLPVGGIKEKVLAARRSGIGMIILPEANRKNLEQIPRGLRRDLKFVFVKHVLDVFSIALADAPVPPEKPVREARVGESLELEVPTAV